MVGKPEVIGYFLFARDTTHKACSMETNPGCFGVQSERLHEGDQR
jgi:hypothetical protein